MILAMNIRKLNKYTMGEASDAEIRVYVGRGSPLGNPYPITKTDPRDAVIARFEVYLRKKIAEGDTSICDELNKIVNLSLDNPTKMIGLVCFCAPHNCHADVLKKVIQEHI